MMDTLREPLAASRFELRFAAAGPNGHDCAFPCDEHGQVDMDALNEHDRIEYLFARAVVGRDLARPVVVIVQDPTAGTRPGPLAEQRLLS